MVGERAAFRWARRRLLWVALAAALAPITACADVSPRSASTAQAAVERELPRGQILRRTLRQDPKQEYLLYVPHHAGRGAPILVTVHGISRNVDEHAKLFAPYAEEHDVVLIAPFFTDERNAGYQRLHKEGAGMRSDRALDAIVEEVAAATGADGRKFRLFGFSGGAQFAHRYTLAHPERVIGAAIGAAGWYTFPDPRTPYPYGLGASADRSDLSFDPDRFLRVPIAVFVGDEDIKGGESLRRNDQVDHQQGTTRLERARRWVAAMNDAARSRGLPPPASCHEVAGIEHSFRQFMTEGDLGERVFSALFGSSSVGANP
jgi:pimeloyl-ACP methyl ester carboxylesterase